jgi:hypothetical protein
MSERWESDSLRWIHEVREKNYKRGRGKSLDKLFLGPSREARALVRKLRLQRVALRPEAKPFPKRQAGSR